MDLATQPLTFLLLDGVCMKLTNNSRDSWGNEVVERRARENDKQEAGHDSNANSDSSLQPKLYGIGLRRVNGVAVAWRVSIRRRGSFIDRSFSVSTFGGVDEALKEAIAFRDEVNRRFAPLTKQQFHAIHRSNNTSGVPGVFRTTTNEWKAIIHYADGRCKTRQFAIHLYGEEEAKQLAIQARAELLKQVHGHVIRHEEELDIDVPKNSQPVLAITPHKDEPAASPYQRADIDKIPGVGTVNVKTVLNNGQTAVTKYRVAEFRKPGGLPKRRYFSVERYGEGDAALLAIEQRQAWEREALANHPEDDDSPPERLRRSAWCRVTVAKLDDV
jgi:hypothetical protein